MNQISATVADTTSVITTAHLVLIILLAIAAILVIWWGGRRRAQQRAERKAELPFVRAAPEPAIVEPAPTVPPVAPAPPPGDPVPVTPITPVAEAAAPATGDAAAPVTLLKGLGPKVAARLGELGVATVGDIAALSPAAAAALDAQLGTFAGRMARDRWVEQAQLLAAGDRAGFETTFGKLG